MVSNETNILFKHSSIIDQTTLSTSLMRVEGSISGVHSGELILAEDNKTIVFNPDKPFANNEDVKVVFVKGTKTQAGSEIPEFTFNFSTEPAGIVQIHNAVFSENSSLYDYQSPIELKKLVLPENQ
ncbi:MAG: hypothetical protein KAS71_10755 [Bacteroidales bacterium]|nr:hypothetical protein [Bacteroidales bacterium]